MFVVARVADDVKKAKDSSKTQILNDGLERVAKRTSKGKCRIPTNPALVANGLTVKVS